MSPHPLSTPPLFTPPSSLLPPHLSLPLIPSSKPHTHHTHLHSPPHRTYLRHQFASLLHALSSTFTSCACGARARDCALRRMAEFVEREDGEGEASLVGEGEEKGKGDGAEGEGGGEVDLGPLVGAPRGFRTRERVPFGGGMGGVEMDVDTSLPAPPRLPQSQSQFQLPPAPSPPPGLDPLPQQMNHTHEGDVDIDIDVEGDWEGDAHPRIDKGKQPVRVHDVACAFRESNLPPVPHPHAPQTQTPTLVLTTPSPDARKRQRIGEKEGSGSGRGNREYLPVCLWGRGTDSFCFLGGRCDVGRHVRSYGWRGGRWRWVLFVLFRRAQR